MNRLDPAEVYRVRSAEDPTALLGLDARLEGTEVRWFDTGRDRGHSVVGIREERGAVIVETDSGLTYAFEPLSLAVYDAEVKPKVELSPQFGTVEELKRFYRERFLGAGA